MLCYHPHRIEHKDLKWFKLLSIKYQIFNFPLVSMKITFKDLSPFSCRVIGHSAFDDMKNIEQEGSEKTGKQRTTGGFGRFADPSNDIFCKLLLLLSCCGMRANFIILSIHSFVHLFPMLTFSCSRLHRWGRFDVKPVSFNSHWFIKWPL